MQFRPESSGSGAARRWKVVGTAPRGPGRRPAREPSTVHGPRRVERWRRRRRSSRRARATTARARRAARTGPGEPRRSRRIGASPRARRAGRCVAAPGTGVPVRCAGAPDHRACPDGTRVPLPAPRTGPSVLPTPTRDRTGNEPGASVTEQGTDVVSRKVRARIPGPVHEPSNWALGHQAWWTVGTAALIRSFIQRTIALRYRGAISRSGDRSRRSAREAVVVRRSGPAAPASGGRGAGRPGDPGRAWTTRAAATSSGSRVTVPASQSMYDGSNAAIWPSVCPWNLPNSTGYADARVEGRRRRPAEVRGAGPGSAARSGSTPAAARRSTRSPRSGGWPGSGLRVTRIA